MKDNTPKNDGLRKFDSAIRQRFEALPEDKKKKQMPKTFILFEFELRENQAKSFAEKEQDSLDLIINHLKIYKKCYVATSFGMDSIVLMDLVIRASKIINAPIPDMILNDTLNTFKEEKAYWEQMIKYFGIEKQFKRFTPPKDKDGKQQTVWSIAKKFNHLPSFRTMAGRGESWRKKNPNKEIIKQVGSHGAVPECCNILKKQTMKNFMKEQKEDEQYDCHFIGTRADESHMRAMTVLQRCRTYLITKMFPYQIRACTPLSFWLKSDIYEYYSKYNIPKNPTYKIHNIERMGCASCPAHKNWELRLAKDPTHEGLGMLKQNLIILKNTEYERYEKSIALLRKHGLVPNLIAELENTPLITDYFQAVV